MSTEQELTHAEPDKATVVGTLVMIAIATGLAGNMLAQSIYQVGAIGPILTVVSFSICTLSGGVAADKFYKAVAQR